MRVTWWNELEGDAVIYALNGCLSTRVTKVETFARADALEIESNVAFASIVASRLTGMVAAAMPVHDGPRS
jgi:hypothetical protein